MTNNNNTELGSDEEQNYLKFLQIDSQMDPQTSTQLQPYSSQSEMYAIIETIGKGRPDCSIVLMKWIVNNKVYWPGSKRHQQSISRKLDPAKNWQLLHFKMLESNIDTLEEAVIREKHYADHSHSESSNASLSGKRKISPNIDFEYLYNMTSGKKKKSEQPMPPPLAPLSSRTVFVECGSKQDIDVVATEEKDGLATSHNSEETSESDNNSSDAEVNNASSSKSAHHYIGFIDNNESQIISDETGREQNTFDDRNNDIDFLALKAIEDINASIANNSNIRNGILLNETDYDVHSSGSENITSEGDQFINKDGNGTTQNATAAVSKKNPCCCNCEHLKSEMAAQNGKLDVMHDILRTLAVTLNDFTALKKIQIDPDFIMPKLPFDSIEQIDALDSNLYEQNYCDQMVIRLKSYAKDSAINTATKNILEHIFTYNVVRKYTWTGRSNIYSHEKSKPIFMEKKGIIGLVRQIMNYSRNPNTQETLQNVEKAMQTFFRRSAFRVKRQGAKKGNKAATKKHPNRKS